MIQERVRLREIAYARSGDKGANANIGVIAYTSEGYEFLKGCLTADAVQAYFSLLEPQKTERYELPKLIAFNFVLKGVLGRGASQSLRVDAQGKALGQALLEMEIAIPESLLCRCRRQR